MDVLIRSAEVVQEVSLSRVVLAGRPQVVPAFAAVLPVPALPAIPVVHLALGTQGVCPIPVYPACQRIEDNSSFFYFNSKQHYFHVRIPE
jgi:hypothetical protein